MRLARWVGLVVVAALGVAGCTASSQSSASGVPLDPHKATDVRVSTQWQVRVPAGAAPAGARMSTHRLSSADVAPLTPAGPGPQLLQAADVSLSSGQPKTPLTFTFHLDQPLPDGAVLYLVDQEATSATVLAAAKGTANPPPATVHVAQLSADRRTGTVSLAHLSLLTWWTGFASDMTNLIGHFTGQRSDPPDCPNSYPPWMTQLPVFLDDQNAPMRVCVGGDDKDPNTAVVKIINNRGGFERITAPVTPSWAWQSMMGPDVKSWLNDLAAAALRRLGVPDNELSRSWLLPPGGEVDIGFSQQAVAGQNPLTVRGHMPLLGAIGGLAYSALDLAGSTNAVYELALFGVCAQSSSAPASESFDARAISEGLAKFIGCVVDKPQAFLDVLKSQLPGDVWKQIAPGAKKLLSTGIKKVAWVLALGEAAFVGMDTVATLLTNTEGAWTINLFPPLPVADLHTVRFDGIGPLNLKMTAADLTARGYTDQGNLYEGMNGACVAYTKTGSALSASVESATGRILTIKAVTNDPLLHTQVGNIKVGATLDQVRAAFAKPGYTIEERLNGDFGQGMNGVIVDGPGGGAIGLGVDGNTVSGIGGVGVVGHAPDDSETGC